MPNPLRLDPTRTTTMRRRFMRALDKQFNKLLRDLTILIVKEDALGLLPPNRPTEFEPTFNTRWAFLTDERKLEQFNIWLHSQAEVLQRASRTSTSTFASAAYTKGVKRALQDTRKLAGGLPRAAREAFLAQAFAAPEATTKIALLSSRSFSGLQGITNDMENKMQRILADGLAQKQSMGEIARNLREQVGFSKNRARTLARTEIVHAHAEGQLDQFDRLGQDVGILAEWSTAGDDRVCPQCEPLEGIVMTVKEARGTLPRHPNCRCTFIPADPDIKEKGQKRSETSIARSIKASRAAETGKVTSRFGSHLLK